MKQPRTDQGIVLGIGLAILANTRPYEGLLVSVPVIAVLLWHLFTARKSNRSPAPLLIKGALPALVIVLMAGSAMCFYFWRVTGEPLRMPYAVHVDTYEVSRSLLVLPNGPEPSYNHQVMRDYWVGWHFGSYDKMSSLAGFLRATLFKLKYTEISLLGPALTAPLIFLLSIFRYRRFRPLLFILALASLGILLERPFHPHYVAPMIGLLYLLLLQGLRHLRAWDFFGRKTGQGTVRALISVCVLSLAAGVVCAAFDLLPKGRKHAFSSARHQIEQQLRSTGQQHLVIVRYRPDHNVHEEWVYNEANIDQAQIVWARDMGVDRNKGLVQYFRSRQIWQLQADQRPPKLSRY